MSPLRRLLWLVTVAVSLAGPAARAADTRIDVTSHLNYQTDDGDFRVYDNVTEGGSRIFDVQSVTTKGKTTDFYETWHDTQTDLVGQEDTFVVAGKKLAFGTFAEGDFLFAISHPVRLLPFKLVRERDYKYRVGASAFVNDGGPKLGKAKIVGKARWQNGPPVPIEVPAGTFFALQTIVRDETITISGKPKIVIHRVITSDLSYGYLVVRQIKSVEILQDGVQVQAPEPVELQFADGHVKGFDFPLPQ